MILVITKKEIEYAIESFIKDKGYMKNDKKLKVNIICGRGEKGLRAEVEEVNEIKQSLLLDNGEQATENITTDNYFIDKTKETEIIDTMVIDKDKLEKKIDINQENSKKEIPF